MNSYKIRIIRPGKTNVHQVIKAHDFNAAYCRAGKSFKSWIDQGFDVQVYNPGEKTAIPQELWKGETATPISTSDEPLSDGLNWSEIRDIPALEELEQGQTTAHFKYMHLNQPVIDD